MKGGGGSDATIVVIVIAMSCLHVGAVVVDV